MPQLSNNYRPVSELRSTRQKSGPHLHISVWAIPASSTPLVNLLFVVFFISRFDIRGVVPRREFSVIEGS